MCSMVDFRTRKNAHYILLLPQIIFKFDIFGQNMRKPDLFAFEQQRHRPACVSAQSDQRLCLNIFAKGQKYTCIYLLRAKCHHSSLYLIN